MALAMPLAYAGGWVWQLTPPLIDRAMIAVDACAMFATWVAAAMVANTSVVAWASAAWSLSIAAWFTRGIGLWSWRRHPIASEPQTSHKTQHSTIHDRETAVIR